MKKRGSGWRWALPFIALLVLLSACGGGDGAVATTGDGGTSGTEGTAAEGGSEFAQVDLSGIDIAVGSKDFDEQLILGHMLRLAFEEAGATVEDRVNLGGTNLAREALLSGEIDVYPEYNGTGYSVHLGIEGEVPTDPEELTTTVREMDLEQNGIQWLGRSSFNNTYGFVASPALAEENGGPFDFQAMADYLEANPDASLCLESEFPSRPDGLVLFEEETGYDVPESQINILDTGLIYTETAANSCDFGEVFTTDGRIPALELSLVEDPGAMILYNISINVRDDLYQQAPEAFDAIAEAILAPLDNERMAALNAQVSFEGEDPVEVARQYLVEEGLIAG